MIENLKFTAYACREIIVPYLYRDKLVGVPVESLRALIGTCFERSRGIGFFTSFYVMRLIHDITTVESFFDAPRHSFREALRRLRAEATLNRLINYFAKECAEDVDIFVNIITDILISSDETPAYEEWFHEGDKSFLEDDENYEVLDTEETDEIYPIGPNDNLSYFEVEEPSESELEDFDESEPVEVQFMSVHAREVYENLLDCDEIVVDEEALWELERFCAQYGVFREILPRIQLIIPSPAVSYYWTERMAIFQHKYNLNLSVQQIQIDELPIFEEGYTALNVTKKEFYIAKYAVYFLSKNRRGILYLASDAVHKVCEMYLSCVQLYPEVDYYHK